MNMFTFVYRFILEEPIMSDQSAVTGAFGYSGKYIAQRLLERGHR